MKERLLTNKEKAAIARRKLITRSNRLRYFIDTFDGHWNPAIETEAYLILEAYQSRRRALWRYFRHTLREWLQKWEGALYRAGLVFWFHRVRRLNREAANEQAEQFIEERIFPSEKGGPECS